MRVLLLIFLTSIVGCQRSTDPNARELVPDPEASVKEATTVESVDGDISYTVSVPVTEARSSGYPKGPNQFEAKIVSLADGDTCTVLDDDNKQTVIRLHGIDCPERGQPYGKNAKEALSEFAGCRVLVVDQGDGGFSRMAADLYVFDDDATGLVDSINLQLVRDGWAWHSTKHSDDEQLAEAEKEARAAKRGLWAREDGREPVWPGDWRKLSKEERDLLR